MSAASPAAARLHDPVAHSHALGGFLAGAALGLAAAVGAAVIIGAVVGAAAAEVASAGLATPLVVGAVATVGEFGLNAVVGGKLMGLAEDEGQALGASSLGAPSGAISAGSPDVKVNGLAAARALDPDSCDASKLAQGSKLVAINGRPASRVGDKTTCGAVVSQGSPNVVIGGPAVTVAPIQSEVPSWARWAVVVAGLLPALGGLARTLGPAIAEVEATGFARAAQTGAKSLGRALEERAGGTAGSSATDQAAIDAAKADQTKWGYNADEWGMTQLKAGDKVYGGLPGQSSYYTDADTLEASGGSRTQLFQSLQVEPHPEFGYRSGMGEYEVQQDMSVPTGTAQANTAQGSGGGNQYFISDYGDSLKLVRQVDLGE